MSFVARLRPELIRIAPPWRTFPDTIAGLIEALAAAGAIDARSVEAARQAIAAREAAGSTALLELGASVPHGRLEGLVRPAVALAASPCGLYEAVPTVSIEIVALVLSPPSATGDHLSILASVATLLRSATLRTALLGARDGAEALVALRRHDRPMP